MYNHKEADAKWQKQWEAAQTFRALDPSETDKDPYYCLIEFPFPSGAGLHVGHPRSFTAIDVIARKRRAQGFNVLYPIGWDAFGLPTENYAIKTGRPPAEVTAENVANFRRQLKSLGLSFDWSREVDTTDPAYYKWTQWMFLEMFKAGLAYKAKMAINWCPKDKIGLANEEVVGGCCERCGGPVEKRDKEQWMIGITKYADRLLEDLDIVNYLPKVKKQQQDWIGRSEGAEIDFLLNFKKNPADNERRGPDGKPAQLTVFTTRPDTLFGATYIVLAPEHLWVTLATDDAHDVLENKEEVKAYLEQVKTTTDEDRTAEGKEKTGVELKGVKAINPATGEEIPMWVADYVLPQYGTGVVMGVAAHDERDFAFATKYGLEIRSVVKPVEVQLMQKDLAAAHGAVASIAVESDCFTGEGVLVRSGEFNGVKSEDARGAITKWLEEKGMGRTRVTFRLRDWVFSRQRYWGEPIPLVRCEACVGKNTTQKDVFLFHGWDASTESDFFPELRQHLTEKGYNVFMFDAPNTAKPSFDEWFAFAKEKIEANKTGAPISIIGHSMGGHLAAKLAEVYDVEKLVLVAPVGAQPSDAYFAQFTDEIGKENDAIYRSFQNHPIDFAAIKKHAQERIVIFGLQDKWITQEIRDQYHAGFGDDARFIEIAGRGHFSTDNGVTKLEAIESIFDSLKSNGWVPLPASELPLTLPPLEKYQPTDTGESPLASMPEWVNTTCPHCGGPAKRETDTMPNWAGSSWYFLRYLDAHNADQFATKEKLDYWMPVDWYNGGMEHTTLHLLYSRFWNKFLYDRGLVTSPEPYKKRTSHGLIMSEDGTKMSKSKGNVVNPDDIIEEFGADTMRVYELFIGPFSEPVPWSTSGVIGVRRFLDRAMKLSEFVKSEEPIEVTKSLHRTIKAISEGVEDMKFNTAVASLMSFVNDVTSAAAITKESLEQFLGVFGWFAPHVANEINAAIGGTTLTESFPLPTINPAYLVDDTMTISVQVNGKLRATIEVATDATEEVIIAAARAHENVAKYVETEPKKVIYIKGKIVSIVV